MSNVSSSALQRCTHVLTDGTTNNGWVVKVSGRFQDKDFTVRAPFDEDGAFLPRQWLVSDKWAMSIESDFFDVEGYRTANSRLAKAINLVGMQLIAKDRPPSDDKLRTATGAVLKAAWLAAMRRRKNQTVGRLEVKDGELELFFTEEPAPIRPLLDNAVAEIDEISSARVVHVGDDAKRLDWGVKLYDKLMELGMDRNWIMGAQKKSSMFIFHVNDVADRDAAIKQLLQRFGAAFPQPEKAGQNPSKNFWRNPDAVALRLGTVLGRKAGLKFSYDWSELPLLPDATDGTIAVWSGLPESPYQGTATYRVSQYGKTRVRVLKGMARRSVVIDGDIEQQGVGPEAQFGYDVDPSDLNSVDFWVFDKPREESTAVNQQLAIFSTVDQGEHWYSVLANQTDPSDLKTVMSAEELAWTQVGLDDASALAGHSLRDRVRKSPVDNAYRTTVYGVGKSASTGEWMMDEDEIRLPEHVAEQMGAQPGDVMVVNRDPGAAGGGSVREYRFGGTFSLQGVGRMTGIALSANSTKWLNAAGDFDGDAALVFPKGEAGLGDLLGESEQGIVNVRSAREDADDGQYDIVKAMADFLENALERSIQVAGQYSIGKVVNTTKRLWQYGGLGRELREDAEYAGQGVIDGLKHAIHYRGIKKAMTRLYNKLDVLRNPQHVSRWNTSGVVVNGEAPDLVTAMGELKRSSKDERDEAWANLLDTAERAVQSDSFGPAAEQFAEYVIKLARSREAYLKQAEQSRTRLLDMAQRITRNHETSEDLHNAQAVFAAWKNAIHQKGKVKTQGAHDAYIHALNERAAVHVLRARSLIDLNQFTPADIVAIAATRPAFVKDVLTLEELRAVLNSA